MSGVFKRMLVWCFGLPTFGSLLLDIWLGLQALLGVALEYALVLGFVVLLARSATFRAIVLGLLKVVCGIALVMWIFAPYHGDSNVWIAADLLD